MKCKKIYAKSATHRQFGLTLHCGEKTERACKALPYFVATGHFKELFDRKYGKKPTSLNIFFPIQRIEDIALTLVEYRFQGVILGRAYTSYFGDNAERYERTIPGETSQECQECSEKELDKHITQYHLTGKESLRLVFMLPGILGSGGVCFCQLWTRGIESSIPNLLSTLQFLYDNNGLGLPCTLSLRSIQNKGVKGNGELYGKKFPVLELHPQTSQDALQEIQDAWTAFERRRALPEHEEPKALQEETESEIIGEILDEQTVKLNPFPSERVQELFEIAKARGREKDFLIAKKNGADALWSLYSELTL